MKYDNYIGGNWVPPVSGKYVPLVSPADTGLVLGEFPSSGEEDTQRALEAAEKAFAGWSRVPGPERGKILYRFADLLEANREDLAETLSLEEGKILAEGLGEVARAVEETRFAAGEASRMTGSVYNSARNGVDIMRQRLPLGPIAVITPWNFPIVTPVRKISPALAYGNTVIFKPPMATPFCAVKLVKLYLEAGVPKDVINLVMGPGSVTGDIISSSPQIRGLTFTGSTTVGRRIAARCAGNMTRVQLEMGGKNPALVYDTEDLEQTASEIAAAAFSSCGQRCTAISRVIVSREEHDRLVQLLKKKVEAITVGHPVTEKVGMGPLASQAQIDTCEKYMTVAAVEGCRVVTGGKRLEDREEGFYFQPTLVDGVKKESSLAREEIFGPILSVITADSFEEGLDICNDTAYGLAGCVFTRSLAKAKRFMEQMDSGMVHVNHGTASQAHVPFGGAKESGFGAFSIGETNRDFYTRDKIVYLKG